MTPADHRLLRLEFSSTFEILDLVQIVADNICGEFGFDDDTSHWVSVAVRESVINAIRHGNQNNAGKRVFIEFETNSQKLMIRVRDQGLGFDPGQLNNPLSPENLLKSSGRGIFIIRSFMDDVLLERAPEGGMMIQMTKRLHPTTPVR
jgi:serine/threonine-protein kinase RsbW